MTMRKKWPFHGAVVFGALKRRSTNVGCDALVAVMWSVYCLFLLSFRFRSFFFSLQLINNSIEMGAIVRTHVADCSNDAFLTKP